MHIYGLLPSPFVQRVLMAARAKGHEVDLRPPPGGTQSDDFLAMSPLGRIPLLETGDGRLVCESEAIVGYLDETLDGAALLPADPWARAHARQITALGVCEIGVGVRQVILVEIFRRIDQPMLAQAGKAQIAAGLGAIERLLAPGDRFAAGETLGIADCLLVPLLTILDIIDPIAHTARLVAGRPKLAGYFGRMGEEAVPARTIREMREGFVPIAARLGLALQPA